MKTRIMSKSSETIAIEIKDTQEKDNDNDNDNQRVIFCNTNNRVMLCIICSTVFCLGMGIMCIMIALQQNQPDETNMIHLEGQIVYVFYLGVGIVFCIVVCLCGRIFGHCCSDLCIVCIH
jgi:heme/copper-type cytochrome/quinol oxidase subunit 1